MQKKKKKTNAFEPWDSRARTQTCAVWKTHDPRAHKLHNTHYITTSSSLTVKHTATPSTNTRPRARALQTVTAPPDQCSCAHWPSRGSVQPRGSEALRNHMLLFIALCTLEGGRVSALPLKEWTKSLLWFRIFWGEKSPAARQARTRRKVMESENLVSRNEVDFLKWICKKRHILLHLITNKSVIKGIIHQKTRHILFHTINVFFLFFLCIQWLESFKKEHNPDNKKQLKPV